MVHYVRNVNYLFRLTLIVWQIAQRDYNFGKGKHRSLTPATYDAIGNCFRSLWGKEAGWAHSVLFTADLRAFSEQLNAKVEITQIKHEDVVGTSSQVITENKVKIETGVKLEPEDDNKRMLNVVETDRSIRSKRRRIS